MDFLGNVPVNLISKDWWRHLKVDQSSSTLFVNAETTALMQEVKRCCLTMCDKIYESSGRNIVKTISWLFRDYRTDMSTIASIHPGKR